MDNRHLPLDKRQTGSVRQNSELQHTGVLAGTVPERAGTKILPVLQGILR
jgi:hypothetical protein